MGLGQDAGPSELPLKEIGIAEANAVRSTELDEGAAVLPCGLPQGPEILEQLPVRPRCQGAGEGDELPRVIAVDLTRPDGSQRPHDRRPG